MLESHGIPTVTIATDAFEDLLLFEAGQRGMPELPYVVIPHPLGGLKPEEARAKAPPVTDRIVELLTS